MTDSPKPDLAKVKAVRDGIPVAALGYPPTDAQRELKARFWLAFKHNPLCDVQQVTPALVEQLTGESVQGWLTDKRFWAWFTISDTVKLNLEVAAERASELALRFLDPSFTMNDNARVQLIKYVLEFSGRMPPLHKVVKWADKDVGDMNEDELKQFIAARTARLPPPPAKD